MSQVYQCQSFDVRRNFLVTHDLDRLADELDRSGL